MFNWDAQRRGLENVATPAETVALLERLVCGELVDRATSDAVIAVLEGTLIVFASFQGRATTSATAAPARSAAVTTTPSVVGKDVIEAGNILIAAGFRAPVGWEVDPGARGTPCTVARQQPAANTQFERGDTAHLFLVGGKDCGKKSD